MMTPETVHAFSCPLVVIVLIVVLGILVYHGRI